MRITATFAGQDEKSSVQFLNQIQWLTPHSRRPNEVNDDKFSIEFVSPPDVIQKIETIGDPASIEWQIVSITSVGILFYIIPPVIARDAMVFVPMSNIAAVDSGIDNKFFAAYRAAPNAE
jgi:hypothetical protein